MMKTSDESVIVLCLVDSTLGAARIPIPGRLSLLFRTTSSMPIPARILRRAGLPSITGNGVERGRTRGHERR